MNGDRELLWGLLAQRAKRMPEHPVSVVLSAWNAHPHGAIADIFLEEGLIAPGDVPGLDAEVEAVVAEHGGDAGAAFAALGGEGWLEQMLRMSTLSVEDGPPRTTPMGESGFPGDEDIGRSTLSEVPGRYSLISQHARGGMGQVLLVHDRHLNRDVAFKELLPRLDEATSADTPIRHSAALTARFLQEARITGQLEHPAIVPVYELGHRSDGTLYYTMKLVKGKTLLQAIKDCTALGDRLALLGNFMDLCHAIAYAHSRDVIHRDIKPGNVMVGQFGETVVLDWGLAKVKDKPDINSEDIEESTQALSQNADVALPNTAYGRALGTPHYMPPEQAHGWIDEIDERSDVYSLGAVLYEILTGVTPFTGRSTREIIQKRRTSEPRRLLEAAPDAPPALASICDKAMSTDKSRRYQSAIEMAEDVKRFIDGSLVKAYTYSLREMMAYYYRRNRALVNIAAVSSLSLLAVGVYSYLSILHAKNREHEQRVIAERTAYFNQLALTQEYIGRQDYAMANKTMNATHSAQRGWEWGYLKNRANPDLWTVNTAPEQVCIVAFSPDGATLVTASNTGVLQSWDTETGQARVTFSPAAPVPAAQPRFNAGGDLLVTAGQDEAVRIWDVNTGSLKHRLSTNLGQATCAEFSPDGTEVAAGFSNGSVQFWDAQSGAPHEQLQATTGRCSKVLYAPGGAAVITVSEQQEVTVWNRAGLAERFRIPGRDAVLSPDGRVLAAVQGGSVAVSLLENGALLQTLKGEGEIQRLRFDHAGNRVLTGASDGQARLYDLQTGSLVRAYSGTESALWDKASFDEVAFAEGDSIVLAWGRNNICLAWDLATGNRLNRVAAAGMTVTILDFAQDGRRVTVASSETFFQCFDPLYQTGRRLLKEGNLQETFHASACPATGRIALSSTAEHRVFSANPAEPALVLASTQLHTNITIPPAFSDDGSRMLVLSDAFCPSLWDAALTRQVLLQGHADGVTGFAFAPDAAKAATASWDATARMWDTASGQCLSTLEGHADALMSVAFSPDGAQVLTASLDNTAALWDAATGKRQRVFVGHQNAVLDAAFDAGGGRIFSASADGTVGVWDARTGAALQVLGESSTPVRQVSVVPRSPFLLTDSDVLQLWDRHAPELRLEIPRLVGAAFLVHGAMPAIASEPTGQLIAPMPDNRVESWEAAPLNAADFDAYRAEDYRKRKDAPLPKRIPAKLCISTSNRMLALALENTMNGAGDGLLLLGLEAGDAIVGLGQARAASAQESAQLLQDLRAAVQQQPEGKWEIQIRRGNDEFPAALWVLPMRESTVEVSLTRTEALMLLQGVKNGLIYAQSATSSPRASLLQSGGMGVTLFLTGDKEQAEQLPRLLRKARLAQNEGLIHADEAAAVDPGALLRSVVTLEEETGKGDRKQFSLDTQHGAYLRQRVRYTIE